MIMMEKNKISQKILSVLFNNSLFFSGRVFYSLIFYFLVVSSSFFANLLFQGFFVKHIKFASLFFHCCYSAKWCNWFNFFFFLLPLLYFIQSSIIIITGHANYGWSFEEILSKRELSTLTKKWKLNNRGSLSERDGDDAFYNFLETNTSF